MNEWMMTINQQILDLSPQLGFFSTKFWGVNNVRFWRGCWTFAVSTFRVGLSVTLLRCSVQWNVQLLCYIGAKYHIVITIKLNLFLRKSIKLATRAAPFDPDIHQIVCRPGLRPRPHLGAYSAPPDPLAGLRGPTSKGRGGEERGKERRGGEGREGKWRAFRLSSG